MVDLCDEYEIDMFEGEAPYTYMKRENIFFKMAIKKLSEQGKIRSCGNDDEDTITFHRGRL